MSGVYTLAPTGERIYEGQSAFGSTPDFDDSDWVAAVREEEFLGNETLSWQPMNPIRKLQLNAALSITPIAVQNATVHVFKYAQNVRPVSLL